MENNISLSGLFIEPRKLKQIILNIVNFQECLPNINLYFYCGKNNSEYHIKEINKWNDNNKIKIKKENIIITELNINNLDFISYSNLLKSKNIWEKITSDYVLTIQTDGCLCKNTPYKISDFFKYDYVGGYAKEKWWWKETNGLHNYEDFQCFNGGFSLRNREKCLDVINKYYSNNTVRFYNGCPFEYFPEDLYFVVGMFKLGYNVAIDKFAINFCSHTSFVNNSYCIHKLDHYVNKDELNKCLKYCNEFIYFITKYII
jgi:hypothetical protein